MNKHDGKPHITTKKIHPNSKPLRQTKQPQPRPSTKLLLPFQNIPTNARRHIRHALHERRLPSPRPNPRTTQKKLNTNPSLKIRTISSTSKRSQTERSKKIHANPSLKIRPPTQPANSRRPSKAKKIHANPSLKIRPTTQPANGRRPSGLTPLTQNPKNSRKPSLKNLHYKLLAVVEDHYSGVNFYMPLVQMFERSEFLNVI